MSFCGHVMGTTLKCSLLREPCPAPDSLWPVLSGRVFLRPDHHYFALAHRVAGGGAVRAGAGLGRHAAWHARAPLAAGAACLARAAVDGGACLAGSLACDRCPPAAARGHRPAPSRRPTRPLRLVHFAASPDPAWVPV